MKSIISLPAGLAAALLLASAPTIRAHTWVEQLTAIASNGTFVGTPGYPRGFVPRTPSFQDASMVNLIPPDGRSTATEILPTDLMCRSSQTIGNQTPGSPALIASPGDHIALRYQENGHVTQPQLVPGKPLGSGAVYVYGTSQPSNNDTYLGIHRVWNTEGTGGDGRGVLLATRHFDDGQCYQTNKNSPLAVGRMAEFPHTPDPLMGTDLWCQTDIQLPANATGSYSLYWVWEWPTLDSSGGVFKNESYTTCMDVTLKSTSNKSSSKAKAVNFKKGQNLDKAAISAQLATPFIVNPTAAQQTFPGATGVPPAPTNTETPSQPNPTSSQGGFITVTVTATPVKETVYITVTAGASEQTTNPTVGTSTITVSPLPASSSTPAIIPSGPSSLAPFLSPESSTIGFSPSSSPQPTTPIPSPTSSTIPVPTSTTYSNGTLQNREYKLRGRSVRL